MATTDGNRSSNTHQLELLRTIPPILLAVAFLFLLAWQWQLSEADSIRREAKSTHIDQAIRLDSLNSSAFTMLAELQERNGLDSTATWAQALSRAPRDPEILIRMALQREQHRQIPQAEALLLRAASFSKTWVPRWSLATFYARHKNQEAALEWAKAAAERGAGDLRPLFKLFESAGLRPGEVAARYLPANRNVLLAYLTYRIAEEDHSELEGVAQQLIKLVPAHPPGWPGLDFDLLAPWLDRKYPLLSSERLALHSVLDRLIRARQGRRLIAYQSALAAISPDLASRWDESQPIMNPGFAPIQTSNPLDWQLFQSGDVAIDLDQAQRLVTVTLSGRQPESLDLLTQIVFLPANRAYQLEVQLHQDSAAEIAGFEWDLRAYGGPSNEHTTLIPSSSRGRASLGQEIARIEAEGADRLMVLALHYRRPLGVARRPQTIRLQTVSLKAIP